jgi:hypothetical protein
MSWIDKVQQDLVIITGDGKEYIPKWLNASFSTEYNFTEFTFIDVSGSLVKKKKPLGKRYNIELYFDGENHLDTCLAFVKSVDDENAILIEHPYYGRLNVQATGLFIDHREGNVSKITGTVIESLEETPISNVLKLTPDDIPEMFNQVAESSAAALNQVPAPEDITRMSQDNLNAYKKGVPIISDSLDFDKYYNAFNTANTYINTATATPILAMQTVIGALQLPAQFNQSLKLRLKMLYDTADTLRNNVVGLVKVSAKQIYAIQQGTLISSMCFAASTPQSGDYFSANRVLEVIEQISQRYAAFIQDLDTLQSSNVENTLGFVANANQMIDINNLVSITLGNLYQIALGSKSERVFICRKDTNIILLAHQLYGLSPDDSTIDELMNNNDLSIDELVQIPKGRTIKYYV